MEKALGAILHGNQKRADLDGSFKEDRNKKTTGPRMRQSAGIDQGMRIIMLLTDYNCSSDGTEMRLTHSILAPTIGVGKNMI